jgi:serine/threonine kinase PknH
LLDLAIRPAQRAYGLLNRCCQEADVDGTPFGRYRLVELLGQGGMGEVWRAYDPTMDRPVALKVLPPNFAGDTVFQERFRREARAAASLDEPHVVPFYDFGEIDGRLYVTMRLINGRDMQALLADGPVRPARAVGIIAQIASALHAAHRIGLVHRDVKPSNILVAEDDFAYLIDFGIARTTEETGLTGTGSVIGTWAYMAPERITTGQIDPRSDIYALACVLHESLTGHTPFPTNSLEQQITAHLTAPPPRPSMLQRGVPQPLDAVIARGMAKNPDQRYQTARDLADAAHNAITRPTAGPPAQPFTAHVPAPPTRPATGGPVSPSAPIARGLGQPPRVPVRPPAATPPPGAPRPAGKRRRTAYIAAAVAGVVGVIATVTVVIITSRHHEISSGVSTATSESVASVTAAQLDGLLLSADQINTAMGASGMTVTVRSTTLIDNTAYISDKACLAVSRIGDRAAYAGYGLDDVRVQLLRQPGDNFKDLVVQMVALFPAATDAAAFFTTSTKQWQSCANRQFTQPPLASHRATGRWVRCRTQTAP